MMFSGCLHVDDNEEVRFQNARAKTLFNQGDCCYLDLSVGGSIVSVFFSSFDQFDAFCKKHNIPFKDERS